MRLLLRIVLWSYLTWFSTGDLSELEWAELLPDMTALCPSIDVCGQTDVSNANSSSEANTCCLGCSCDSNCRASDGSDNCCFRDNDIDHREQISTCLKPSISQSLELAVYTLITKPPINGCNKELDDAVKSTCSSDVAVAPWGNFLPVYSKSLNMHFKNKPCALCHGVDVMDLKTWTASIGYLGGSPRQFVSVMTHFYETFNSSDVDATVLFDPPSEESVKGKRCYELIDECSSRSAYRLFHIPSVVRLDRPAIIRACKHGPRAIYARNVTHAYKNVFCAICDYFAIILKDALTCTLEDSRRVSSQSFAGLIDSSFLQAFETTPNHNDQGLCFRHTDALNGSDCVEPSCPSLQVRLQNGECAYPAVGMKAGCFRVNIHLSSPHTTNKSDISEMDQSRLLAMFEDQKPWPEMWETAVILMVPSNGTDFLVALVFQAKQYFSLQNLIKGVKRRLSKQWSLRLTEEVSFKQDFQTFPGSSQDLLYNSHSINRRCLIIDRMFYCQQIELHPSEYSLGIESKELRLLHSGKILYTSDYTMTVGEDGSERVRVCLEESGYVKVNASSTSGHVVYGTSGLRELLMAVMAFVFMRTL